jgi:hypothetical protein
MLPDGPEHDLLWSVRKATALAALCEQRRCRRSPPGPPPSVPYPEGRLTDAELDRIADQARQWLAA